MQTKNLRDSSSKRQGKVHRLREPLRPTLESISKSLCMPAFTFTMFSKLNPYSIVKVVKYLELRFNYIGEFLEFSSVHSMVVIIA